MVDVVALGAAVVVLDGAVAVVCAESLPPQAATSTTETVIQISARDHMEER
jgi:hypothetical protein